MTDPTFPGGGTIGGKPDDPTHDDGDGAHPAPSPGRPNLPPDDASSDTAATAQALAQALERARIAEARVAELEHALAEARETLDAVERRHRIDTALIEADAIDLDTARLLTEMAVADMPDADIAAVIAELQRDKPFLFRHAMHRRAAPTTAAAGASLPAPSPDPVRDAAHEAAATGNRRALLRYLRARRTA